MRMPKGVQPLLILHGYNPEDLDRWAASAEAQMKNMTVKFYMKVSVWLPMLSAATGILTHLDRLLLS